MKFWLSVLCCCLLLSACTVTVDEPETSPEEYEKSLGTTSVPIPIDDALYIEKAQKEGIIEKLGDIFQLDWLTRKEIDAQDIQYLALGDSLTDGVGDEYMRQGYTERLVEQLEKWPAIATITLDNRGKKGRRSDQLLRLLEKGHYDKELEAANLVTLTMGGNDVMKIVKTDIFSLKKEMFDEERVNFQHNYEQIVKEIRARNPEVPLILIGFYNPFSIVVDETTPFEEIIVEWNNDVRELAAQDDNACFVPVLDLFHTNEDLVYHTDFFHPNAKGYERMTERIVAAMKACDIEEMSDGLIGFEE
ncbi:GDSL-type esterase/lipase family protein [Metasolibacillus sp.]|uniref:GDSL-type esterase/lipase family protein n=1 Tax=Metasolibacillus sp. TaxID=2703680 RepID=UPI0025E378B7|nr:GDSL-type esterase/lipase family protein [Metasolibacillus sp.]MCT6925932.1 GDSL-type esterase/lipase family protein [Metasolibacillus sp.]MCT6942147.1 GDSL-type esterase/lipase family protein [Metasolibacillus sp.]